MYKKTLAAARLLRPQQWVKNLFVIVPVFFGGAITDTCCLAQSAVAFAAFCLAASAIYCLNDVLDAEADRQHPEKCRRPVASGAVGKPLALTLMGVMAVAAVAVSVLPQGGVAMLVAAYLALNVAYCLWLKHFAIVDVCVVAAGFVIRVMAGGMAAGIALSHWIVLMTFLLTLFLSLAKRRDDVVRMNRTGKAARRNTERYNLTFMNQALTIAATVTLVCYIMYTISPEGQENMHTDNLYLTSVFVIIGLLRYMQIAVVDERSGDPTDVALHDHFIQAVFALWLLSFLFFIYLQ